MANPLYQVPGLGGYLAGQEQAQQQTLGQLQTVAAAQTLGQHFQEQAELSKARDIIQTEKDPQKVISSLVAIGPTGAAMAQRYAAALHSSQQMKLTQQVLDGNGGVSGPDTLRKIGLATGNPGFVAAADRAEKLRQNADTLGTMRSQTPAPLPAGSAVPGTSMQTTQEIPAVERPAFDRVAAASAAGQTMTSGQQPSDQAPSGAGLFSSLIQSRIPQIAQQAKVQQELLDKSGNSIPAQHWQDVQRALAAQESSYLQNEAMLHLRQTVPPVSPATVDAIGQLKMPLPPRPSATRNPNAAAAWDQMYQEIQEKYPDFSAEKFPTIKRTEGEFATGAASKTLRSLSNATGHLDTYERLALAMNNGDVQLINSIVNSVRREFGSAAPTNPQAVAQFLAGEIVKASTGAEGALTDRANMQAIFANKSSPEQMVEASNAVREIMGQQFRSLEQQYKAGTYGRNNFADKYLSLPEVRAAYDRAVGSHGGMTMLPQPAAPTDPRTVVLPGGGSKTFPTPAAANAFRKAAGL